MTRRYFPWLVLLAFLALAYGFLALGPQTPPAHPEATTARDAFFAEL